MSVILCFFYHTSEGGVCNYYGNFLPLVVTTVIQTFTAGVECCIVRGAMDSCGDYSKNQFLLRNHIISNSATVWNQEP